MLLTLSCAVSVAQQKDTRTPEEKLSGFHLDQLRNINPNDKSAIRDQINIDDHILAFVYYALPPTSAKTAFNEFLKSIEPARVDQQLGTNPSSGAATSTVAKAGLTSLVSAALETGALTQTIDQDVATLHANAAGLYRFLSNQEVIPLCSTNCGPSWIHNVDLSASFNVSSAGTKTFTGQVASTGAPVDLSALVSAHNFSSATIQYAVWNKRDFRSKEYHDSFTKWFKANAKSLQAAGSLLSSAVNALLDPVERARGSTENSTQYSEWLLGAIDAVAEALSRNPAMVFQTFAQQLDRLINEMQTLDPQFQSKVQALAQAYAQYFSTEDNLGINMITAPQLLILATYSKPALQPNLINAKISYARSPGSSNLSMCADVAVTTPRNCANPGTLTFNLGVDIYQSPQPMGVAESSSTFRDAQAAVQFDRPIGPATSPAQFSFGAYYQYQSHAGIFVVPVGATSLPNTNITLPPAGTAVLTNTKGSLYAIAASLTVQIPGAGLKVPIGFSWSNSTDLVKGNELRAHIGFTFNSEGPLISTK